MPDWKPLHDAPRDRSIILYLPTASYQTGLRGHPIPETVKSAEVIGRWDAVHHHWVDTARPHHPVYPSQWRECDA